MFAKDNALYRKLAAAQKAVASFGKFAAAAGGVALAGGGAVLGTVAALFKRVSETRKGLSGDEAGRLALAGRAVERAWEGVEEVFGRVVAALLPSRDVIREVYAHVAAWTQRVREFVDSNQGLIRSVVVGAAALVAGGAALVGLGAAASEAAIGIGAAVAVVKAVAAAVGMLLSPVGLAVAAVAGLTYLFATQTETGQKWAAAVGGYFGEMKDNAVAAWGGIVDALKAGDLQLAGRIALAALSVEWARAKLAWQQVWTEFKAFFVDGWHDAVMLVELAWNDLTSGLASAMATAFEGVAGVIGDTIEGVLAVYAKGFRSLGLDGVAGEIEAVAALAKRLRESGGEVRAAIESDRSAEEDRIIKAAQDAQAERDRFRAGELAAAQAELDAAVAERDAAVEQARKAAQAAAAKKGPTLDDVKAGVRTAGQFGGAFATQAFGGATVDPVVDAVRAGNAIAADQLAALKNLKGLLLG